SRAVLQFADGPQVFEQTSGLLGIDAADGEPRVNEDVIAHGSLRHTLQANRAAQPVELDDGEREPVALPLVLDQPTGEGKTQAVVPHWGARAAGRSGGLCYEKVPGGGGAVPGAGAVAHGGA